MVYLMKRLKVNIEQTYIQQNITMKYSWITINNIFFKLVLYVLFILMLIINLFSSKFSKLSLSVDSGCVAALAMLTLAASAVTFSLQCPYDVPQAPAQRQGDYGQNDECLCHDEWGSLRVMI